jgi:hypothetical protein
MDACGSESKRGLSAAVAAATAAAGDKTADKQTAEKDRKQACEDSVAAMDRVGHGISGKHHKTRFDDGFRP